MRGGKYVKFYRKDTLPSPEMGPPAGRLRVELAVKIKTGYCRRDTNPDQHSQTGDQFHLVCAKRSCDVAERSRERSDGQSIVGDVPGIFVPDRPRQAQAGVTLKWQFAADEARKDHHDGDNGNCKELLRFAGKEPDAQSLQKRRNHADQQQCPVKTGAHAQCSGLDICEIAGEQVQVAQQNDQRGQPAQAGQTDRQDRLIGPEGNQQRGKRQKEQLAPLFADLLLALALLFILIQKRFLPLQFPLQICVWVLFGIQKRGDWNLK